MPGKSQPDPPGKVFPLERSQRQLPHGPANAWEPWAGASDLHTGIFLQSMCSPCTHSSLSLPMVTVYGRITPRQTITRFPGVALYISVLQEIKNHTQRYLMFSGWRVLSPGCCRSQAWLAPREWGLFIRDRLLWGLLGNSPRWEEHMQNGVAFGAALKQINV